MKVLFISECEKKALKNTRRILDLFAPRIGRRTWCTEITENGLITIKNMLKKRASKLTAVSCFWQKKNGESDLLWTVGRRNVFNIEGFVSIKKSDKQSKRNLNEDNWICLDLLSKCVVIAGLFHDFGKSSKLFQSKLYDCINTDKKGSRKSEPYRHEWISALYFFELIKMSNATCDNDWLEFLSDGYIGSKISLNEMFKGASVNVNDPGIKTFNQKYNNDEKFPYAIFIIWLILSHHRLPKMLKKETEFTKFNSIKNIMNNVTAEFISSYDDIKKEYKSNVNWLENFEFYKNTSLFQSSLWVMELNRSCRLLKEAKSSSYDFLPYLNESLFFYLGRISLILADHECSSSNDNLLPSSFEHYANTGEIDNKKFLNQRLDSHCISVAKYAGKIAKKLPFSANEYPSILSCKEFRRRSVDAFKWQDVAYDTCVKYRDEIKENGFFGVNLASTGKGKTFANARIMYAISEGYGCRISFSLGLRTLTNQTGQALIEKLNLDKEDIAVITGENKPNNNDDLEDDNFDSYNKDEFFIEDSLYVDYELLPNNALNKWLKRSGTKKIQKIVCAPILVSTVDTLVKGLESDRGAHHIVPALRLLSSDLVLDEVDDYDINDLPAILRMIYTAGLLGANVLLSSATVPRILLKYAYQAYSCGRCLFNRTINNFNSQGIMCGFFDEFNSTVNVGGALPVFAEVLCNNNIDIYKGLYDEFYNNRILNLRSDLESHATTKAKIVKIEKIIGKSAEETYANIIYSSILELHEKNKILSDNNKYYSIGIVRFANITPLIDVFKEFIKSIEDTCIENDCEFKYVVYHSKFPLIIRSNIEKHLDLLLNRKNSDEKNIAIQDALNSSMHKNVIIVIFASPIAEVGRDHDYDWAIIEPSSMRSIIQLSGRVQRHRRKFVKEENIYVLSKNIRRLPENSDKECFFDKPGFEAKNLGTNISCHDLIDLEVQKDINFVSSIPRLQKLNDANKFTRIEFDSIKALFSENTEQSKSRLKFKSLSFFWTRFTMPMFSVQKVSLFRSQKKNEDRLFIRKYDEEAKTLSFFEYVINSNRTELKKANDYFKYIDDSEFETSICSPLLEIDESELCLNLNNCDYNQVLIPQNYFSNYEKIEYNKNIGIHKIKSV